MYTMYNIYITWLFNKAYRSRERHKELSTSPYIRPVHTYVTVCRSIIARTVTVSYVLLKEPAWKCHVWKKGRESAKTKKPRRKFHFKQIARFGIKYSLLILVLSGNFDDKPILVDDSRCFAKCYVHF